MGSPTGFPGYDIFPGKPGGGSDFGWGRLNCCRDNTDPSAFVTIGYSTLVMSCDDIQGLTVEGYNPACLPDHYTWAIQPASGTLVPGDYIATYTAPAAGGGCVSPVTISLMCDGVEVDFIVITINACPPGASIGYTTKQMSCTSPGNTQTLTAVPSGGGCGTAPYTWAITAGGGALSPSTGPSVVYTAPSTNAQCVNNPTITLSCGGVVLDTLGLAVNQSIQTYVVGYVRVDICDQNIPNDTLWPQCKTTSYTPHTPAYHFGRCCETQFKCNGDNMPPDWISGATSATPSPNWCTLYSSCPNPGVKDNRAAGDKAQGCCPMQIL